MELIKVVLESGKATLKIPRVYKHSELTHAHGHIPVNHTLSANQVFTCIVKVKPLLLVGSFCFLGMGSSKRYLSLSLLTLPYSPLK